jgi:hypothetical protein
LLLITTLPIIGCKVSSEKLPKQDELKLAICNSIQIPFHYGDTVIYQSFIGICGNSSKDELNRYYEPQLNKHPFIDNLKSKYKGAFLYTCDSLYALMERQCKDNPDSLTVWDCFSKDKIDMQVTGEILSNKSVRIYETYGYNKEYKLITKIFTFDNSKWSYKIDTTNRQD